MCQDVKSVFPLSSSGFSNKYLTFMVRGRKKQLNKYERNGGKKSHLVGGVSEHFQDCNYYCSINRVTDSKAPACVKLVFQGNRF